MSDETDEEAPRSSSFFHSISRNFSYVVGLFFLIWLVLAKNIPSLLAPHNPAVVHKAEQPQLPQAEEEPQAAPAAPVVIERETVPDADTKHIANLEEQVATLKSEVADLKSQLGNYSNAAEMDEKFAKLKARIDELQGGSAHQLTVITAFSIMKEAAVHGESFANEYKQLAGLITDAEQKKLMAALEPYSASGIITNEDLKNQFNKTLTEALSGHSRFDTLIRIRKEGEQQKGSDDEAVLARAEAKISRGEIAATLAEIQTLSPTATETFAQWGKNAKAMLDARDALNALQIALLPPITPEPKTTPKPDSK